MTRSKSATAKDKENKYIPRNRIEKVFNGFKNLFGVAGLFLGIWTTLLTAFSIGPIMAILMYADGYEPAIFTVEKLSYIQGQFIHGKHHPDRYWADGTVNGQSEMFKLGEYIKGAINNREELEKQIKIGQKLPVLYNAKVPKKLQKRVMYPEMNFHSTWKNRQSRLFRKSYIPLFVSLGLCFLCGIVARNTKSAMSFIVGSTFLVLFALIPNLINIYF
ncbi:hypothetical protein HQ585_16360 [candidate division KSB1 bacterium]|nr:hypothetical protein [candidate division KSB1 bacterium]